MKNAQLEKLIEEMVDQHASFIRGYAELIRRAYRLGRNDERMGIPEEGRATLSLNQPKS